jgi:hypothetical protein
MFDVIIDGIDLLNPPFCDDEMGELCGGNIRSVSLLKKSFEIKPVFSGQLTAAIFEI